MTKKYKNVDEPSDTDRVKRWGQAARQFCFVWLVGIFTFCFNAPTAYAALPFYDSTAFTDKPAWFTASVPEIQMLSTSGYLSKDYAKIDAKARRAQDAGQLYLIDLEHGPAFEKKYGRKITDRELLSLACQEADRIRAAAPALRIGIWMSNKIDAAPYQDNLVGDKDPTGKRARRSLMISTDWVGIGAYIWHSNIRQWLTWYPDLIHKRRLAWRGPIICYINVLLDDGTPVPLDHLSQMVEAIQDDIDAICFFSKWKHRHIKFDEDMPWVQFIKKQRAEREASDG